MQGYRVCAAATLLTLPMLYRDQRAVHRGCLRGPYDKLLRITSPRAYPPDGHCRRVKLALRFRSVGTGLASACWLRCLDSRTVPGRAALILVGTPLDIA